MKGLWILLLLVSSMAASSQKTQPEKAKDSLAIPASIKKDSYELKLVNDMDIPLYHQSKHTQIKDTSESQKERKAIVFKNEQSTNIDSIVVYETNDTTARVIVYTTDGNMYYNNDSITLNLLWKEEDRLYLNGDHAKNFMYLKDVLQYHPGKGINILNNLKRSILIPKQK
jgi:hypothetical protein